MRTFTGVRTFEQEGIAPSNDDAHPFMSTDPERTKPMITCTNVEFTYDGDRLVLAGINARIKPGEFVCILGGNGSGKSTLAKHFNALLVPDAGRVSTDGMDTADEANLYAIRSTAGMVFQNPDDQLVASLVEDDVAFGPENLGVETSEIARRVHAALKEVGLIGFEKHETNALSGGQKQRVAIAGVLAMEPKILILDEASSMLDPRGRKGLMRVCKELHERGMTIVMITHFMEEAAEADRVIVLEQGRVALEGTPEEVLARTDVLGKLNLEVPFACRLSTTLRERGAHIPVCIREDSLADAIAQAVDAARLAPLAKTADSKQANDASCDIKEQNAPLIEFDHVSHTYLDAASAKKNRSKKHDKQAKWGNDPHAVWALRDATFAIERGEFVGIAGHTGSGKSTLIQHMNGILKPTCGRVLVDGKDIADKKEANIARSKVGVVFQYPERQLFAATVYDDVAFGPRNMGLDESEVDERVRESLARVDLDFETLKEASPFELSGGQQRRVAFAGVLAMRPSVLVLDEPTAGLDPAARRDFLTLISSLHEESGLTVVMVSHSMDDLAAFCQKLIVLKEGDTFAMGAPETVFLQEREIEAIGLGVPAAQRMAGKLRERGVPMPDHTLYSIESLVDMLAPALANEANDEHASAPCSADAPGSVAASCTADAPVPANALRSTATAKEDAR